MGYILIRDACGKPRRNGVARVFINRIGLSFPDSIDVANPAITPCMQAPEQIFLSFGKGTDEVRAAAAGVRPAFGRRGASRMRTNARDARIF